MRPFTRPAAVFALTTILLTVCAGPSLAMDYYVNGTNGDDSNSGLSRDDGWKTITHALSAIEPAQESPATIHIAEGAYAASTNGETLPLVLKSYTRLVGEGAETSILNAEYGANHIVICQSVENVEIAGVGVIHSYALGEREDEDGGCAIICDDSSILLNDCEIAENRAMFTEDAGAILCRNSSLALQSCTVRDNLTDVRFGPGGLSSPSGVRCVYSLVLVRSCLFEHNVTDRYSATSGISCGRSAVTIENSRFYDNAGSKSIGLSSSTARILACSITGNMGAAVRSVFGTLEMRDCMVRDNLGLLVDGSISSGPFIDCQEMDGLIQDCVIEGNRQGPIGAEAISCFLSTLKIRRCLIRDNDCGSGTVTCHMYSEWTDRTGQLYIEDSVLSDNISYTGAVIYCLMCPGYSPGIISLKRCSIIGNAIRDSTPWEPSVIYNGSWTAIQDSVIWGNDGGLFNWGPGHPSGKIAHYEVDNCCLQEEFEGEGNFVADPMFVSGPLGDYYLSSVEAGQDADSPCIDAGSTSASIAGVGKLTTRTDGAFDAGVVDIGYHYSATPPTIECFVSAGNEPLHPGDVLSASIDIENAGLPLWVDIYAGFILPDGSIFCVTPTGLTTDIVPWAATSLLPSHFVLGDIAVFDGLVPGGLPEGPYTFAAALSVTGQFRPIGDVAFAEFQVQSSRFKVQSSRFEVRG